MRIGYEIIKMFGEKLGKDTTLKAKVQETNSLEARERLAAESFIERRKQDRLRP